MSSSVLEMPSTDAQSAPMSGDLRPPAADSIFSETAIHALNRDDAMASGMIAVILSIAFLVLLGLVVSVSVWTMRVTA